jgi:glyoxalase/bleomycin resistance protein/dioxygenase superfamily protein
MFARAVDGMPNCSEPTRLPITRTATCTTGSGARGDCSSNLHAWDAEEHPNLVNADAAPPGHGVVLWFQLDDFDLAVERARRLGAEIIEEPHINPAPRHREIWLRDPDGYVVVVASPDGDSGS